MTMTTLEQREVFHIVFLRRLAGRVRAAAFAVKGGVNLRLFFKSPRYSEDMDLDISGIETFKLKDVVMDILTSKNMQTTMKPYGVEKIVPPDIKVAKQTETTQRFKVHLITSSSEDLFTKVEFSRRRMDEGVAVETIDNLILQRYKLPPLMAPHYSADTAALQKIAALAGRAKTQARDIFDIYNLIPQVSQPEKIFKKISGPILKKAQDNVLKLDFLIFRDTVLAYLSDEDKKLCGQKEHWEEMQLKVSAFLNV